MNKTIEESQELIKHTQSLVNNLIDSNKEMQRLNQIQLFLLEQMTAKLKEIDD